MRSQPFGAPFVPLQTFAAALSLALTPVSRFVRLLVSVVAGFFASAVASGMLEGVVAPAIAFGSPWMLGLWVLCSGLILLWMARRTPRSASGAAALPVADVRPDGPIG